MSGARHFTGGREPGKKSIAREILLIEMQKKGKLPAQMRYKMIFKRRQEDAKEQASKAYNQSGKTGSGNLVATRKMSARAEQSLKEMAMKKAAKEAKKLRKMVIVQPKNFSNGSINAKGQIFDIAGNIVGQVNTKDGRMTAASGWSLGKYKAKSYLTDLAIQQAIEKHSPYFIKQRQMMAMQQAMANVHGAYVDPNVMNVHGISAQGAMLGGGVYGALQHDTNVHGAADEQNRSNITMTAWGAMSNNALGIMSNNIHGTMGDNIHGTVSSDIWGSVGSSSMWGQRGPNIYGTGSGVNRLSGLTKWVLGLFGYQSKSAREALRQNRALRAAGASSSGGGPRPAAPARRR